MIFSGDERSVGGTVPVFESLEERQYLTTVVGGETIEYVIDANTAMRIKLEGEMIAEIVGVTTSVQDDTLDTIPAIGDIAGLLTVSPYRQGAQLGGGYEGLDGLVLYANMLGVGAIDDLSYYNFSALASDDVAHGGATFVLNVEEKASGPNDMVPTIVLYELDIYGQIVGPGEIVGSFDIGDAPAFPVNDDGALLIDEVLGADFQPAIGGAYSNWIYFTGYNSEAERTDLYRLDPYAVDPADPAAGPSQAFIMASVENVTTLATGDIEVTSLAWDQISATEARLLAFVNDDNGQSILPLTERIPGSGQYQAGTPYDLGDGYGEITGIEFVDDDITAQDDLLYMMSGAADSVLYIVDLTDPADLIVTVAGPLEDVEDDPSTGRGDNLSGLAWHPLLFNPFTGTYGALIATDIETDELVIVDHQIRSGLTGALEGYTTSLSLFAIYIVEAGPDASIVVGEVYYDSTERIGVGAMSPFSVTAGSMLFVSGDGIPAPNPENVPTAVGGAVIGVLGLDGYYITSTQRIGQLGNIPRYYDAVPEDDENQPGDLGFYEAADTAIYDENIYSGIVITENILESFAGGMLVESMLEKNLDRIEAMSVNLQGEIYVVDNDYVDGFGNIIAGSQIIQVDSTGQAVNVGYAVDDAGNVVRVSGLFDIVDSGTGTPLTVADMDFGDLDFDGTEELYAVVYGDYWDEAGGGNRFGTIDPHSGLFTEIGTLAFGATAMAFSPSEGSIAGRQGLYMAGADNFLYEINPSDGSVAGAGVAMTALHMDAQGNTGDLVAVRAEAMDFEENGTLFIYDQEYGRLMDMGLDGVGGMQTLTIPGSLRPRVGAIAYSYADDTFYAMDNSLSYHYLEINGYGENTEDFYLTDPATGNPDIIIVDLLDRLVDYYQDGTGTPLDINGDPLAEGEEPLWHLVDDNGDPIDSDGNPTGDVNEYVWVDEVMWRRSGTTTEGAVLMRLKGLTNEDAELQQMANIFIAGVVTGKVDLAASVDTFYAGWLITGDSEGRLDTRLDPTPSYIPNNFTVDGDLRNLLTTYTVGGRTEYAASLSEYRYYETRFELYVGGKLGWFASLDYDGDMLGTVTVMNNTPANDLDYINSGPLSHQTEKETLVIPVTLDYGTIEGVLFENFQLNSNATIRTSNAFSNDLYLRPQYLGSVRHGAAGEDDVIVVDGTLQEDLVSIDGDPYDFYGVGIMAGQTISVQLIDRSGQTETPYWVFVMDPDWVYNYATGGNGNGQIANAGVSPVDLLGLNLLLTDTTAALDYGNVVATDFSDTDRYATQGQEFSFTAEKSGTYIFAIVRLAGLNASMPYTLEIGGVGDLAVGAITAGYPVAPGDTRSVNATYYCNGIAPALAVARGDVGRIAAGGDLVAVLPIATTIVLSDGSLRSIDAGSISDSDVEYSFYPLLNVNGDIGLIRAVAVDSNLFIDATLSGSINQIYANNLFGCNINAGGGLGVVHAGSMDYIVASIINLNTDNSGNDGILDMLDVVGDMGYIATGGPQITTGPGGNVRYIQVGGTVWQDIMFTDSWPAFIELEYGESKTLRDDSGGTITISVESRFIDPIYGTYLGETAFTYLQYGIRTRDGVGGGGGGVLMEVSSGGNLIIEANTYGNANPVEIGTISLPNAVWVDDNGDPINPMTIFPDRLEPTVTDDGRGITTDINGDPVFETDTGANLYLLIDEKSNNPVDIYKINGGKFTSITNNTVGEIANIEAESIGLLETKGTVGYTRDTFNGQAVCQIEVLSYATPYSQLHNAVWVAGVLAGSDTPYFSTILEIDARGGIGNVYAQGDIVLIEANRGGSVDHTDADKLLPDTIFRDADPIYRGIVGGIFAEGDIYEVHIGEGIATAGTGYALEAGLFSWGRIETVIGEGYGADIYGDIMAYGGIGRISLTNGSIINADISTIVDIPSSYASFRVAHEWFGRLWPATEDDLGWSPIDLILVQGRGGIIGSYIHAGGIGDIIVSDGFGFFNSHISCMLGMDDIGNIVVDGFGIRNVEIFTGDDITQVSATGNGDQISTADYSYSVRKSEDDDYESLFGMRVNALNDIHAVLGTTTASPEETSGMIENVNIKGQGRLGRVRAYSIISTGNSRQLSSNFDFINHIGTIVVLADVNGMEVTSGSLGSFVPGGDVMALDMSIAGKISSINIKGDLADSSSINASGPNGYIVGLKVAGSMDGSIHASGRIGTVKIEGDLSGQIVVEAVNPDIIAFKKLYIGGSFANGSLESNSHVGSIIVLGSFGIDGDWLDIAGDLGSLQVGRGDSDGAVMNVDLSVTGDVGYIDVTGALASTIYVGGDLGRLTVRSDEITEGTVLVDEDVTVRGALKKVQILGGDLDAEILAGLTLGSLTITDGDVTINGKIISSLMDIGLVDVKNGDMLGAIQAPSGKLGKLYVDGDLGAAAAVEVEELGKFSVDGSMIAGARVAVEKEIDSFVLGGNLQDSIDPDAVEVSGIAGGTFRIGGNLDGDLELTWSDDATDVRVDGDMDGSVKIWSDASIRVSGNTGMGSDAEIFVDGELERLAVDGTISGTVLVNGESGKLDAGAMDSAVITSGGDVKSITVDDAVENSVIQVGFSVGSDATLAGYDAQEGAHIATLNKFTAGSVADSIIASSGDIEKIKVSGGLDSSSVSAGLNLGSQALAAVAGDADPLADAAEQNAARSGTDRQLYSGYIKSAVFGLAGMVDSSISAGVDAGADGEFGTIDDNILSSLTGGMSIIKRLSSNVDVDSVVVTDSGLQSYSGQAAGTVDTVDYDIDDVASEAVGANLIDSASAGNPATFLTNSGEAYSVTVSGPGQVNIYDEALGDTDDIIDVLALSGTNSRTTVTVTSTDASGAQIGKLVTEDDASVGSINIEGALAGDGTNAADLWLDGGVKNLAIASMGGQGWTGGIGDDVNLLQIEDQQSGKLNVAGEVKRIEIIGGDDGALFGDGDAADTADINTMAVDFGGGVWNWDSVTGELYQAGAYAGTAVTITDMFGNTPDVSAMDFAVGNSLFIVATVNNPIPNSQLNLNDGEVVQLTGLTAGPGNDLYAIATDLNGAGLDWLVSIDSDTGVMTAIGSLRDIYGNSFSDAVVAMTYDGDQLLAMVTDRDGSGGTYDAADGLGIIAIELVDDDDDGTVTVRNPNLMTSSQALGGGADTYVTMAAAADGTIYAIRRNGATDELVTIEKTDGTISLIGTVQFNNTENTTIVGMDFDASGNLVAYSDDGDGAELIVIDLDSPEDSNLGTMENSLAGGLDGFAFSGTQSYAYDNFDGVNNTVGLTVYTSHGVTQTPGFVDTDTGDFTILPALLDSNSSALTQDVIAMAVDNADSGDLYVVTGDHRLARYDIGTSALNTSAEYPLNIATDTYGVTVADIDFDDLSGELVVLDASLGAFFTIDKDTGHAKTRSGSGVVNTANISTFAIDPVSGSVVAINSLSDELVEADGTRVGDLNGIVAQAVASIEIGESAGGYAGRIASDGDIKKITVKGDYSGLIYSDGDIGSFTMSSGNYSGAVVSSAMLGSFKLSSSDSHYLAGGLVDALEIKKLDVAGEFLGTVWATTTGSLSFRGDAALDGPFTADDYALANVVVLNDAKSVDFDTTLYGSVQVNDATSLSFDAMAEGSSVIADGDVNKLKISGNMAAQSALTLNGHLKSLNITGEMSGIASVLRGMGSAKIASMDNALLSVARDTSSVKVGVMTDSVLSFGAWIGDDGIYNTSDDVIIGGSVKSVTITTVMTDSAIVAGVLPNQTFGSGIPDDKRAYIGNATSSVLAEVDSAEAGGIMQSSIGKITASDVYNTSTNSGHLSVVAAADEIGRIKIKRRGAVLKTREYEDVYGAPVLEDTEIVSNEVIELYFSEELNTASLILSIDGNMDGLLNESTDIIGTITVSSGGVILNDVILEYETYVADDGTTKSVVTLRRIDGFDETSFGLEISGLLTGLAVYDRSGMRSALRDFNSDGDSAVSEDRPGSIYDGNQDRVEGDGSSILIITSDGDTIDGQGVTIVGEEIVQPVVDAGILTIYSTFYAGDYDIYTFSASAWQFLSVEITANTYMMMDVFYADGDGFTEALTRFEDGYGSLYGAYELPLDGDYYVIVRNATSTNANYALQLRLASSDDMLDGNLNGQLIMPQDEQVAYISNEIGDQNNLLGANTPTQLVYLNFEGGRTTDYINDGDDEYTVEAFDLNDLNSELAGYEDAIINGDIDMGVTGIVDKVLSIYRNLPADLSINVELISTIEEWASATSGIYFTLDDPAQWEDPDGLLDEPLDETENFTTLYIGAVPTAPYGLLGMASYIDLSGQDKADNAIIALQNFAYYEDFGYMTSSDAVILLNQYSTIIATTVAHELGHTLGWNHQTQNGTGTNWDMLEDDPTDSGQDSNTGMTLMGYPDDVNVPDNLGELGTMELSRFEFGLQGVYLDTAQLAHWWFA